MTFNELTTLTRSKRQSPIDLRDDVAKSLHVPPLVLIGHWMNDGEATLVNNGRYPMVKVGGARMPSIVKCGPLGEDEYELHNAHFHWGEVDGLGSEHSINNTWFALEAHVVHWNRKYMAYEEAQRYKDGLCILVYFFQSSDRCECQGFSKLESITDHLKYVVEPETKTPVPPNCLSWMRAATKSKYYYCYRGSYNKNDFPECATLLVFPNYIPIRSDQVAEFRKLKDTRGKPNLDNRRKQQHLNDRRIYKCIPP